MKWNQLLMSLMVVMILPSLLFSQVDSASYYPLVMGDWREYSIYANAGDVQGLVREGVVDTFSYNGHSYSKQFAGSPISNEITYVREDSDDYVVYLNRHTLTEDTLCIFDWDFAPNEREWIVGEDLFGEGSGVTYGFLQLGYYDVGIPTYPYIDGYGKKLEYRMEMILGWSGIYSAGIGEVYYISEGYGKFIQKLKRGDEIASGYYTLDAIDTVTYTSDQIEFSNIATESGFDFDFSFNPSDYGWSGSTIGAIQFSVAPRSEMYSINTTISGGGIAPSQSSISSIALDSNKYFDCLDGRYIGAINVYSDPINVSGRFRTNALPAIPGISESGSLELMDPDSFEVSLLFTSITVGVEDEMEIVEDFKMYDAYPNPFNPNTTIPYELPKTADVAITIYDLLGLTVWSFEEMTKPAGYYSLQWDGINQNGKQVVSGVYLISLSTPEFRAVQKAVLIR
jgi:hypothetical protein